MPRPTASRKAQRYHSAAELIERWFHERQRSLPWRERYDPYEIWISEVMLQQTRMEVVLGYFSRFIERFPDVMALAAASEGDVLTVWSGLGYYRRARFLLQAARQIRDQHGGMVPNDFDSLRKLPGVGRYTAGAISSIAFDEPRPIVDGNVARLLARFEGLHDPLGSTALAAHEWRSAEQLVRCSSSPRVFNQGMMELGALVCRAPLPACSECPVSHFCVAFAKGLTGELPVRKTGKEAVPMALPLFIVRDERGRILMRKQSGPLMDAMYHLPHGSSDLLGGYAKSSFRAGELLLSFRHTITHRRIRFDVFAATLVDGLAEGAGEFAWIAPEELESIPHPSYVRKAVEGLVTKACRARA